VGKGEAVQLTQQGNVGHLIDVKVIRCTSVLQADGRLARLYLDDERVPAVEHHAHESRLAAGAMDGWTLKSEGGAQGIFNLGPLTTRWCSAPRPSFRSGSVYLFARRAHVSPYSRWA